MMNSLAQEGPMDDILMQQLILIESLLLLQSYLWYPPRWLEAPGEENERIADMHDELDRHEGRK